MTRNNKGQSSLPEYVVTFFVVIAAAVTMTIYIQRSLQAKTRDARDHMFSAAAKECDADCRAAAGISGNGIPREYEPYYGYINSQTRRDSDALQRKYLADVLQRSKSGIDEYTRKLADAAQLGGLSDCDRLRGKIDRLIGRIRGAMQGYSGIFDLVKVDETRLDQVYEYDLKLIDQVEALAEKIKKLSAADKPPEVVAALLGEVEALDHDWDHRSGILQGLE